MPDSPPDVPAHRLPGPVPPASSPWPAIELLLGGQKSGKSRAAERRAEQWLQHIGHEAVLIATALPADAEMDERIRRHQDLRKRNLPALLVHEESQDLAAALRHWSAPGRLVVVDCLTLWLSQLVMPPRGDAGHAAGARPVDTFTQDLLDVLPRLPGPVVLVSNEIGLGVVPLGTTARQAVDALGALHQQLGALCARVTLMVAGCELAIKGGHDT